MANLVKVRKLLETISGLAMHLSEEEISQIGIILNSALQNVTRIPEVSDFLRNHQ